MRLRQFGALVVMLFLAVPFAFAVESGKAEGDVTINRKPVKLKYAFAKKEKDSDKKDRWVVVLTDRPVSRSLLSDSTRFHKAVENGDVAAVEFHFGEGKKLEQADVQSKALQHGSLPMSASKMQVATPVFTDQAISGSAKTTEEQTFFSDVATLDVKFSASLGAANKFGDNAVAAKDLAASRPKINDGEANGSLILDGTKWKLTHALARTKPNAFDEKKTDVAVLMTEKPVAAEVFADETKLFNGVKDGSVHGLLLTIDDEEKPYHLHILDPNTPLQMSGSGIFNFDASDFSEKHVSGRFFTTADEDFMGKHKYSYDVSFAAPVPVVKAPADDTVDATTGKPLPAGGGDVGKTYMAFDKASRAGKLADIKKFVSKTRPMPDMNAEETKQMLELMKLMRPANLKILGGFVSGDRATLNVEGEDPGDHSKSHGTIEMVKEDGGWKILAEKWKS